MGVSVVFAYDGAPKPQAVTDAEGRVRVWHDRADRYGWADLFVTWDGDPSHKMAPATMEGPARAGSLPTQEEGVEPGPSGDDQPAGPVPSHPRRPFAGMERQLADHRHQLEALRDHLGVIERTFTRYESFVELRDQVARRLAQLERRLDGGVALLDRIRTLESHLVDQRQRIGRLEGDLRQVTQREGL